MQISATWERQGTESMGPGARRLLRSPRAALTLALPLSETGGGKAEQKGVSKMPGPVPDTKKAPDKYTALKILLKIRAMLNVGNQEVYTHSETS